MGQSHGSLHAGECEPRTQRTEPRCPVIDRKHDFFWFCVSVTDRVPERREPGSFSEPSVSFRLNRWNTARAELSGNRVGSKALLSNSHGFFFSDVQDLEIL